MRKPKITARTKYSNGGLNAKKTFDGVGSLEASAGGDQNYRSGNVTASRNIGGARVSASKFKDSMGNSSMGASYNKQTKGGTNFRIGASRDSRGALSASMSISKPL